MPHHSATQLLRLALVPAVVGLAVANAQAGNTTSATNAAQTHMGSAQTKSQKSAYRAVRASEMIGMHVRNPQGKDLGEINDLIVNMHTGDVRYAVLEFDPGIFEGERLFAVPTKQLRMAADRDDLVYNMTRDKLENARVDKASWDQRKPLDTDNLDKVWGIAKATDGPRAHRASDLIGKDVNGHNGDDIGDIKDLVIDLATQKVHYAVLAFDPGWTSPENLYAFPLRSFTLTPDRDEVMLDIDKSRLQKMKSFNDRDFAKLNDPTWKADMDHYFVTVLPVLTVSTNGSTSASNGTSADSLFARLDTNRNGSLSKAEVKGSADLNRQWALLDQDDNGRVTREEFANNYASAAK